MPQYFKSLSAGRAVLLSDVMPMPEFGGTGLFYFSPFDLQSIAAAVVVIEAMGSPERAAAVATPARERGSRYDWTITAEKTWNANVTLAARPN